MPPQPPPPTPTPDPNEPGRIDVSLNLFDQGSLQAAQALSDQLRRIYEHRMEFGGQSAERQAGARANVAQSYERGQMGASAAASVAEAAENVRRRVEGPPQGQSTSDGVEHPTEPIQSQGISSGVSQPPDINDAEAYRKELRIAQQSWWRRMGAIRQEAQGARTDPDQDRMGVGDIIDRWNELTTTRRNQAKGRSRQRINRGLEGASMPDAQAAFGREEYDLGQADLGTSLPPDSPGDFGPVVNETDPKWLQAIMSNPTHYERAQAGFRIPRFGEFTVQDKLNMVSDMLTRRGENRYRAAAADVTTQMQAQGASQAEISEATQQVQSGQTAGRMAVLLNQAADVSPQIFAGYSEFQRLMGAGQNIVGQGTQSGYSPQAGTWGFGGFGIRNPFSMTPWGSPAAREGWSQWWTNMRLRAMPGVNEEQAKSLQESFTGLGWSGQDYRRLVFGAGRQLVQQGQDPRAFAPLFDQALRTSTAGINDVRRSLDGLNDVAKATRMTVNELTQGMGAYAEAAEGQGATYAHGLQAAREFSQSTGLPPQLGTSFLQSPLIQAQAMMTYGTPPQTMGVLSGGMLAGVGIDAIGKAMQLAQPMRRDVVQHTPGGDVTIPGERQQIAAAAEFVGLPPQLVESMWKNRHAIRAAGTANTEIEAFREEVESSQHVGRAPQGMINEQQQKVNDLQAQLKKLNKSQEPKDAYKRRDVRQELNDAQGQLDKLRTGTNIDLDPTRRKQLVLGGHGADPNEISWGEVSAQMRSMGIGQKHIDDLYKRHHGNLKELSESASRAVTHRMRKMVGDQPAQNEFRVRFTGAAARYFEQISKKLGISAPPREAAQSGGAPTADWYSGYGPTTDPSALLGAATSEGP